MDALMQWGTDIVVALQAFPGLTGLMEFFTFLGTEEFFLLLMPALYWCIDAGLGLRLAVALTASGSLNELLKLAFHLPRPYWVDSRVQALGTEPSYGLPSGHAMNAVSVWGFIATQLKKNWAWAAALALILLISLSRLYLGVHFPTDVLGGWVFGAGLLWAFLRWEQNARVWLGRLTLWQQIGLAFVVSLVYLALAAGILTAMTGMPDGGSSPDARRPPRFARSSALTTNVFPTPLAAACTSAATSGTSLPAANASTASQTQRPSANEACPVSIMVTGTGDDSVASLADCTVPEMLDPM